MPVTQDNSAPYAPTSAIIGLIDRHRDRGLPKPITSDVLARAGISESLIPRTLQALQTLDLVTEDGQPSNVLEGLRLAPEVEFKQRMTEWLNAAYADALNYVDPADADEVSIRDAFRSYKPTGQQDRMVTLFTGLYAAAGVREARERQTPKKPIAANVKARSPIKREPKPAAQKISDQKHVPQLGSLPPAISGLLASLPLDGEGWPSARRNAFMQTFNAVIDFCFPIVEPTAETNNGG